MYNFFEFYERVRRNAVRRVLFGTDRLDEADFKRGVDYSAQADYAAQSPSGTAVGSDQYTGRNTANNAALQPSPEARQADKAVQQAKWDQAKAANPDLEVYEKLRAANRADRKTAGAADKALKIGDYERRGGRVSGQQTDASTTHSYRGKLEADRDPAAQYAVQIDEILHKNHKKYHGQPLEKAYEMLQQDFPASGTTDLVSHIENLKAGLFKLFHAAGPDLFSQKDGSWVVAPKEATGDMEDVWGQQGPVGDMKIYKSIQDLKKTLHATANDVFAQLGDENGVWFDPRIQKLAKKLFAATNLFLKSGRVGGKEKAEVQQIHDAMKEMLDAASSYGG